MKKYYFADKKVTIDKYRHVYDENNICLGKSIKCDGYEHYLVGTSNKGPIIVKK